MEKRIKVGILRETKIPYDRRVPLTPPQIATLEELYPFVEFYVQPSGFRGYSNEEYHYLGIQMKEDLSNCDILMGVKEVDKKTFIPGKTYLFFAHVGKKQTYNREMFLKIISEKIRLIDYEYLVDEEGRRVVAFGRFAGIVGAYNALRARGIKTNRFDLKPAHQCNDMEEMWAGLKMITLKPGLKILITGEGRVAGGAMETLNHCNIVKVSPEDFLTKDFDIPVVCQIGPEHYTERTDGASFSFEDFVKHPGDYRSAFKPFAVNTDILIACHYWDPRSPLFFTREDMKQPEFRISVIADISCDINGPVPSTLRATTIADPFYGYNPETGTEEKPFLRPGNITVMAIDNLPGELPRDASADFGKQLMRNLLHDLFTSDTSPMINRATITENGLLTPQFSYLNDYIND